jgi:hypothetical protein
MKLESIPFAVVDWDQLTESSQSGDSGSCSSRTMELGDVRLRLLRYSADFLADHWCVRGHLGYVLEGDVVLELRDGSEYTVTTGMTFQIPDSSTPHRVASRRGARVLIVD